MDLLVIGIALWIISHTFKRLAPGLRAKMGDRGKGLMAILALAGIVLMVIGYRTVPPVALYQTTDTMRMIANILMFPALFFAGAGSMKGVVASKVRHNMLTGFLIWAIAHLLANGDHASFVLFGSMAAYAVASMLMISRAEPWDRPAPGPIRKDLMLLAGTIALYAVIAGIHVWLGHNPFKGTM